MKREIKGMLTGLGVTFRTMTPFSTSSIRAAFTTTGFGGAGACACTVEANSMTASTM